MKDPLSFTPKEREKILKAGKEIFNTFDALVMNSRGVRRTELVLKELCFQIVDKLHSKLLDNSDWDSAEDDIYHFFENTVFTAFAFGFVSGQMLDIPALRDKIGMIRNELVNRGAFLYVPNRNEKQIVKP